MQTSLDCLPCFLRQTLRAARTVSRDPEIHRRAVEAVLQHIARMDFSRPPPLIGRLIYQAVRELSGTGDPYAEIKQRSNRLAQDLFPKLQQQVESSPDAFEAALRMAIAGNIIDFGTHEDIGLETVHQTIEDCLVQPVDSEAVNQLNAEIRKAESILYLGDNAGEILFDRLLIERLPRDKITFAVRGAPIINDATLQDAEAAGLTGVVRVIDNGSDIPGTQVAACSEAFQRVFESADLVIAKGQGNFETLSSVNKNIFFLFMVKCSVVAQHCGRPMGSSVILHHLNARQ